MATDGGQNEKRPRESTGARPPRRAERPLVHAPLQDPFPPPASIAHLVDPKWTRVAPQYPPALGHVISADVLSEQAHLRELRALLTGLAAKQLAQAQQVAVAARMLLRIAPLLGAARTAVPAVDTLVVKAWEVIGNGWEYVNLTDANEALADLTSSPELSREHDPDRFHATLVAARLLDLMGAPEAGQRQLEQCILAYGLCLNSALDAHLPAPHSSRDRQADLALGLAAVQRDLEQCDGAAREASVPNPEGLFVSPLWDATIPTWSGELPESEREVTGWTAFYHRLNSALDRSREPPDYLPGWSLLKELELRYPALMQSQSSRDPLASATPSAVEMSAVDQSLDVPWSRTQSNCLPALQRTIGIEEFSEHVHAKEIRGVLRSLLTRRLAQPHQVAVAARMFMRVQPFLGSAEHVVEAQDALVLKAWEAIVKGPEKASRVDANQAMAVLVRSTGAALETDVKRQSAALVAARLLDLMDERQVDQRKKLLDQCVLAFLKCLDGWADEQSVPRSAEERKRDVMHGILAAELDIGQSQHIDPEEPRIDPELLFVSPLWIEAIPVWFSGQYCGEQASFGWAALYHRLGAAGDRSQERPEWSPGWSLRQALELRYPQLVEPQTSSTPGAEQALSIGVMPAIDRTLTPAEIVNLITQTEPYTLQIREEMRTTIERFLKRLGAVSIDKEQGNAICQAVNGLLKRFDLGLKLNDGGKGYGRIEVKVNMSGNVYLVIRSRDAVRSIQNSLSNLEVILLP